MAIRNRRGTLANFDPSKLVSGEFAYTTDTGQLFYCYGANLVKELATNEDVSEILNTSPTAYVALQKLIEDLSNQPVLTGILADISALETSVNLINAEMNSWATSPWIDMTLINGWIEYDTALYRKAQYYKDKFGWVHFRGMIKSGTIGKAFTTLPVGYRGNTKYMEIASTSLGSSNCEILSDGNCTIISGSGASWYSLNGIKFRVV